MKSRILQTDSELELFREKFMNRGNDVSLGYLQQSKVRGFFSKEGEMVAGYAVNESRPLRYEGWIPKEYHRTIPVIDPQQKLCELTCIWIASRKGRGSSEKIYLRAVMDAFLTGADYIIGGTLSKVVSGIQTQSLPTMLYSGYTDYFGAEKKCWVYCASRWMLLKKMMFLFPYGILMAAAGRPIYLNRAKAYVRKQKVQVPV